MSGIGIMEGAFFVGRKEIVDWINNVLHLSINRIEDTASGAISCQLVDIMYSDICKVPMHKVNWSANKDFEYVANYKILQGAFTKAGVDKYVDVDRLISGRYMDNLEFMQWFKKFFETHVSAVPDSYDVIGQRAKGKGGAAFFPASKVASIANSLNTGASKATKAPLASNSTVSTKTVASRAGSAPSGADGHMNSARSNSAKMDQSPVKPTSSGLANKMASKPGTFKSQGQSVDTHSLQTQLDNANTHTDSLSRSLADAKVEMEGLEKERDFYFDKLREIEVMLQEAEENGRGNEISAAIFKILYATADGFEVVNASDKQDRFQNGNMNMNKENHMPIGEGDFESF